MACGHTKHYRRLQETTGDYRRLQEIKSSQVDWSSKSSKGGCIQFPQEDTPGLRPHRNIYRIIFQLMA
eukprot:COSAG02_NODE_2306_length_9174_cov_10.715152_4_plen_68_part_00